MLFATTGFFLVVVFALFFGDTVASEAQWGSLRYTLATPVPRHAAAPAEVVRRAGAVGRRASAARRRSRVVAGGIAFGFDDDHDAGRASRSGRATGCCGWPGWSATSTVHLLVVGTLAFWLSTITDAPLAAVGGAVFTMFVFAILDQVEQLGRIRDWFPTAGEFAWTDLLQTPVDSGDLFRGVIQSLVYAASSPRWPSATSPAATSPAESRGSAQAPPGPSPRPSRRR